MNSTWFTSLIDENISTETERLKIYPLINDEKIFKDLFEIYSSKTNVQNYCEQHTNSELSQKYLKNSLDHFQNNLKSKIIYVIELKSTGKIIGIRNVMLDIRVKPDGEIEPNFRDNVITEIILNENYWNKGYAYEASKAIFEILKNNNISYALTFVPKNNTESEKLDRRLGFVEFSIDEAIQKFGYFKECTNNTINQNEQKVFVKGLSSYFPYESESWISK